ncbi:hypothetical protein CWI38_2119p0010, partial [Hamiltosporidium tvaerminnensis]
FISTDGIYSIWKSKILEIFNNAPLFLYSILPEILSIKNLVKEDSKSIKPQGGNYLVTLLIFEAIVGNPSLNNEKINMKNQKIEGFTDLTICSQSLSGISAYLRMLLEDIERMMEILKELKNTYLPKESYHSLLHSVEKDIESLKKSIFENCEKESLESNKLKT